MIDFIADNFYYVFLGWIILSLVQRRYRGRGDKKRTATLIQSILIFILYMGAVFIREEGLEKKWIVIPFVIIAVVLYFFRSKVIPYELKCRNCGAKLNMNQIFLYDANLCADCDPHEQVSEDESDDAEETEEDHSTESLKETEIEDRE
ncbi:MAG: hypothetical protein B6241_06170 [Spirochaetaceae bacterium 4572_59]|nr:MAG: hypothetical protein B6241_06170 [Spirochaetaceae bacterium 4572_59]